MGGSSAERFTSFYRNRWLVFVAAMWLQSWAGIGYLFGSISPVIKSSLNYNQRQLARLGVAKDLGDCVGFITGILCEILPSWGALLVGSSLNFVGYGWVWLIVTGRAPALPLWAMCVLIFVGTNGETYFNTVSLVSCIQNFPKLVPVCVCLLLAAYLMGVMVVQDLVTLNHSIVMIFTAVLFVILLVPIFIPISTTLSPEQKASEEETLLPQPETLERGNSEVILSEVEDEKPEDVDSLPSSERKKRIAQLQSKLVQAAAISQSLQYDNTHIFVSIVSIWNFLGRVGGGYISEIVVRDYAFPRSVALAGFQLIMAFGHVFIAMGWPGAMYVSTLLIGLGYGAHWSIAPAAASELFGLRNFGALYNFLTLANPSGTLIFSSLIASRIYDYEAEQQALNGFQYQKNLGSLLSRVVNATEPLKCVGSICFFLTCVLMAGLCMVASVLSMILVHRTKTVYAHLYGKSSTGNSG
ncbi:hypothetical protein K1719_033985 [Acacia pycnantha]|nr:hypothetical protein K1719_033985 [Acacia pycnantha]